MRHLFTYLAVVAVALAAASPALASTEGGATAPVGGQQSAPTPESEPQAKPARPAPMKLRRAYSRQWRKLAAYGLRGGRRHLVRRGVEVAQSRPATARELRRGIRRMKVKLVRFLRTPAGVAAKFRVKVRRAIPQSVRRRLRGIAGCESGGNPKAVSDTGKYRGAYQFSFQTWRTVGGSGDPAKASIWEQTWRAAVLLKRSGPGQWPVCGR